MFARSKHVRAMLNSLPSRTYTSETSVSEACRRLHAVSVSMSCFVATRSLVTEDSILLIYAEKLIRKPPTQTSSCQIGENNNCKG